MKVRIATLTGNATKKRSQKEGYFCLQGIGINDFEAIKDLKTKLDDCKYLYKSFNLKKQFEIYDGEKDEFSLSYSLIPRPETDNLVYVNAELLA